MHWLHTQMALLDSARAVVSFAANWALQSTLLIAAGLAIARLLGRRGSALQSAIYRTTLAAVIVCPLATALLSRGGVSGWSVELPVAWTYEEQSPLLVGDDARQTVGSPSSTAAENGMHHEPATLSTNPAPNTIFGPETSGERFSNAQADAGLGGQFPPDNTPVMASTHSDGVMATQTFPAKRALFEVRTFGLAALAIAVTWLAVSAVLLWRLSNAWRRLGQLRRAAVAAEPATQQACRELAALLAVAAPEVRRTPYLASPCLAGLLRPVVLLPEAEASLPLRDVLIHELAHLRRRDGWWNLLTRLAEALFFYQPLLWTLARRLDSAAEEVCDDYVVQLGGNREGYARGLLEIAELSLAPVGAAGVAMVSLRSILARRVTRIVDSSRSLSTRAGNLLVALVIAGGLVGATAAGLVGLRPQPSLAEAEPTSDAAAKNGSESEAGNAASEDNRRPAAAEKPSTPAKNSEPPAHNQLEGRVVGADGKSVAGATIYWIRSRVADLDPEPPRLMATTGEDGRFRFAARPAVSDDTPASWSYSDRIVIQAPGHGFALLSPSEIRRAMTPPDGIIAALARSVTGDRGPTSLRAAGEPIRGRLVDINGQPVIGATVRIRWFGEERDRLELLKEAETRGAEYAVWQARAAWLLNVIEPVQLRDVLPSATTDAAGRFELRGIGAKRLLQLLVQGEGIESSEIVARNEPGEKIVIEADVNRGSFTLYPNEFVHAVGPSTPVEGRVLDLDTGEPIAGAVVRAVVVHGQRITTSREREHFATTTDARGRYRITGLPIGNGNKLVAFATGNVAYVPIGHTADTSAAGAVIQQDFRLKRGVWAEGRVFDAETRKPFTGEISYYFFRNRELEQAIAGLRHVYIDGLYWTNANGQFRVPVLPSRGILAFRYDGNGMDRGGIDRYARGFGANEIAGSEPFGGDKWFPTEPHYLIPTNYERIAEVPATEGKETVRVDMPLSASHPAVVRVVDSQGEPVVQFQAYGANELWGWQNQEGPQFEIQGLRPGERRKVFVFHRSRNLAGGGFVEFGGEQAVEIRLAKAGSVHGRLVDAAGAPIDDATLSVNLEKLRSSDNSAIWARHPDLQANPEKISVDKEGRFRLDGLIPGWTYHAHASAPRPLQGQTVSIIIGSPLKGVQVEAGENKDLGDLVVGADTPGSANNVTTNSQAEENAKTVRGRVTRGGKPASGAHVAVLGVKTAVRRGSDSHGRKEALAEGTADENGEYLLRLPGVSRQTHRFARLICRQDGSAVAWRELNLDAAESEVSLELKPEEPLRGKLIDVEGRPAAGVRMSIALLTEPKKDGEDSQTLGYLHVENAPAAWIAPVASDDQGRFVVPGVAADLGVVLDVAGDDRFAQQEIALNTGWNEERGLRDGTYRPLVKNVKPGEEALLVLAPAQVFDGTVRYADSGEAVPHARVSIWASQHENGSMMSFSGSADDEGHYHITPRPGIRFGLTAYPPAGVPYLARRTAKDIHWQGGERVKNVDFTLPRGVLLRGTVVEAGSGAPVAGAAVRYEPESLNNRNASDDILGRTSEVTDEEGRFTIAVLPGPGRLLVNGPQGKYVLQEIGSRELYSGKPGGKRYYVHAHTKLNPAAGQDAVEVKLELEPGATVKGRVVDEAGKAIDEVLVISRLDVSPQGQGRSAAPTLGGRYELSGLAEGVEYPVYFLDPKRRLGATEVVKAGDEQRTVVLKPCGQASLRLIDGKGEPMPPNYGLFEMVVAPGPYLLDRDASERGELAADAEFIQNIDRTNNPLTSGNDESGERTMNALIPGATYRVIAKRDGELKIVKEFQVKPNETVDFGDITVEREP